MERFKNKFNSNSNRMNSFDYSENWYYFVTICTKDRENKFWEIKDWIMMINDLWKLVYDEILNIPKYRENVVLDEFIIMPNHIHLILGFIWNDPRRDAINRVSTTRIDTTSIKKWWATWKNNIMLNKNSLGYIIRIFKWKSKFLINKKQLKFFSWQSNYYDRIIRGEKELEQIRKYIIENPLKREWDKNNIN